MNLRTVWAVTSGLLFLVAFWMLAPLGLAVADHASAAVVAYAAGIVTTLLAAATLRYWGRNASTTLHRKDAFGVVVLIWFGVGVFGGIPFVVEGSIPHPISAAFEAVSGFTTTGATVVDDVDGLSRATNLWRCLMHWIGGMGIVVLFVAVFPQLGVGAKQLFKAEVPGPITEGLRPRVKQTALALWWIYTGLTVGAVLLLWGAGMSWFDAVCHAFSALGTGGYSTRTASVGGFNSAAVEWILFAFMMVAGLNFGLFYGAARGRWLDLLRNYELRFYLLINALVIGLVTVAIRSRHGTWLTALRYASFQVAAVTTTTGFMTEDFDTYPDIARLLLFLCMFMGGCAGSTAGGLKASRVYVLVKAALRELRAAIQPSAVVAIHAGRTALPPGIVQGITVFATTYLLLFGIASLLLVGMGLDLLTGMSATVACLSSVGPGLAGVGPAHSYAFVPPLGKLVLIVCMIAGRLEIFALLAVFHPESWRR